MATPCNDTNEHLFEMIEDLENIFLGGLTVRQQTAYKLLVDAHKKSAWLDDLSSEQEKIAKADLQETITLAHEIIYHTVIPAAE